MAEVTKGQEQLPSGVYRHKESGIEMVALETRKFGNPQADALVHMGFEYVGPVQKDKPAEGVAEEVKAEQPTPKTPTNTKTNK